MVLGGAVALPSIGYAQSDAGGAPQTLANEVDEVTRRVLSDPFITLRFVALALETPDEQGQALNGIVRALLARGDLPGALNEVRRIEDNLWNGRSLAALGDYQNDQGDKDSALDYYAQAVARVAREDISIGGADLLRRLAIKQAGLNQLDTAIETARLIPIATGRVAALQQAASASFESGNGNRASVEAAKTVLRAAFEEAKTITDTSQETARLIIALGDAQAELEDQPGAQESFRHARKLISDGARDGRNESYAVLSASMIGANQLEEAMEVVRLVERGTHQVRALSSVARALGDRGNLDTAVPLFTLAREATPGIDDDVERARAIAYMIREQVRVERYADAFNAAGAISDRRLQSEALLGMADELLKQGKADAALVLVDYIPFIGMRAQIFGRVAEVVARAGNKPEAEALIARAFEETGFDPFPDYVPDASRIILATQMAYGDRQNDPFVFSEIRKLADLIEDELTRVDVMARLATAEALRGETERANRTLSSAWRNAWLNRRAAKFPKILESIVEAQIAIGDVLSAFDTAARIPEPDEDMLNARTPAGDFTAPRFRSLKRVAVAASRIGETDLAIRAAREIEHPPARAAGLAAIAVSIAVEQNALEAGEEELPSLADVPQEPS